RGPGWCGIAAMRPGRAPAARHADRAARRRCRRLRRRGGSPPQKASTGSLGRASRSHPMALATGHVVVLVLVAREAMAVGVAPWTADAMASHAELLTGPTVAARARERIDTRLHTVIAAAGACREPPGRVRVSRRRPRGDVLPRMAVGAR